MYSLKATNSLLSLSVLLVVIGFIAVAAEYCNKCKDKCDDKCCKDLSPTSALFGLALFLAIWAVAMKH